MRRFEFFDIEVERGIVWEESFEIVDADGGFVPFALISSFHADIVKADKIEAEVIVPMNLDILDDVDTKVRLWLPENVTQTFPVSSVLNPVGYWFFYYVDVYGERVPLKRGKVNAR